MDGRAVPRPGGSADPGTGPRGCRPGNRRGGGRPELTLASGTRLVLVLVAAAAAIAVLRMVCVPVGSFRAGLDELRWGMGREEVVAVLGEPNRICDSGRVDHLALSGPDSAAVRRALAERTNERWIYSRREPRRPIPRDRGPGCRAPSIATEIGFDAGGRLRWVVREMDQTDVVHDPALVEPAPPND